MTDDRIKDAFKNLTDGSGQFAEDAGYERMIRLAEALAPVVEGSGEESADAILAAITRIAGSDRRAALILLEECPAIIRKLSGAGDKTLLNVFDIASQMIPFGAHS